MESGIRGEGGREGDFNILLFIAYFSTVQLQVLCQNRKT